MRQLSSLEAQLLALETRGQSGHVAGVAILDPSTRPRGTLALADIQALMAERLTLLAPLRWRLEEMPRSLDHPHWVDDGDLDLDLHVRGLVLPAPGNDSQLSEQVARIIARPLDRSRPLWELYMISGLSSGHVAMLTKIHHAIVDDISGAEITRMVLDLTAAVPKPSTAHRSGESPAGHFRILGRGRRGLSRTPRSAPGSPPAAVPKPTRRTPFSGLVAAAALRSVGERIERAITGVEVPVLARERLLAPMTSFNGCVSADRRFVFGHLGLDDVNAVKNAYGCTVNDVVVSICAAAVRRWLVAHDELPNDPLVAQIPVSVRTDAQAETYRNQIILMSAPLFTNEADPIRRLMRTRAALDAIKEHHRTLATGLLHDANHLIPAAVFARAARVTFLVAASRPGRPTWNLVISNVAGPPGALYCAGARLVANYPVSAIADGMGLNITVVSYCGKLDFGIVSDREQMPDVTRLMGWLGEALYELKPKAKWNTDNPDDNQW